MTQAAEDRADAAESNLSMIRAKHRSWVTTSQVRLSTSLLARFSNFKVLNACSLLAAARRRNSPSVYHREGGDKHLALLDDNSIKKKYFVTKLKNTDVALLSFLLLLLASSSIFLVTTSTNSMQKATTVTSPKAGRGVAVKDCRLQQSLSQSNSSNCYTPLRTLWNLNLMTCEPVL